MSQHRYPPRTLWIDYCRALLGLGLTLGPLLAVPVAPALALLLAGLAALFTWFGARTLLRQLSRIELTPAMIAQHGPLARRLPWPELRAIRLQYYARGRERPEGWLQLTLRAQDGARIQVDSTIDGFAEIAHQAQAAASRNRLEIDQVTAANLAEIKLQPRLGTSRLSK